VVVDSPFCKFAITNKSNKPSYPRSILPSLESNGYAHILHILYFFYTLYVVPGVLDIGEKFAEIGDLDPSFLTFANMMPHYFVGLLKSRRHAS